MYFLRLLFEIFVVDDFSYKNGVDKLLRSTLEGQIILGTYAKTKVLDCLRLKDIVILSEIQKDPIFYKYVSVIFLKLIYYAGGFTY